MKSIKREVSFSHSADAEWRHPEDDKYKPTILDFTLDMKDTIALMQKLLTGLRKAEATGMCDALVQFQISGHTHIEENE